MSRERLYGLVCASLGSDEAARELSREILPVLSDLIAVVLTELVGIGTPAELTGIRSEILGEIADMLVRTDHLELWRDAGMDGVWGFIDTWGFKTARRLRDKIWVRRAVVECVQAARESLFALLMQKFSRAAKRRHLGDQDREEARQHFSLWLLEGDCRALRRWDPNGGRSFGTWFYARALNQIDTWRRGAPALPESLEHDPMEMSLKDEQIFVRQHLRTIQRWLEVKCSERHREIFVQTFLEEKSAVEIGAALGMQPAAVYMVVLRLRKAIAVLFDL